MLEFRKTCIRLHSVRACTLGAACNGKEVYMHSVWLGEFLGTLVLVLLGNGVNAGVTLRKSYAADAGWMVIAAGWALAVLCGVLVAQAFGSPGANLNPAITLAVAIANGNYAQLFSMWSAQLLGAMAGAALMTLHYAPHWALTPDPAAKLGVFCTNAAIRSPMFNILSEALGTAVLVLVAGAIYSHGVAKDGPANGMGQWLLPIPGKGGSNWRYAPIPIIGDLAGAALAGLLLHYGHL